MGSKARAGLVGALIGAALLIAPTPSVEAGESVTITVQKVIIGTPPPGAEFLVEFPCGQAGVNEFTFTPTDLGPQQTFALLGPCTVSETVDGGADEVSYDCVGSGDGVASCTATATGVDIEFVGSENGGDALITVTNTYLDDPPPDVDPDTDEPAPDVVTATPPFTG